MRKETSTIMALVVATILTAYVSALTMSNQAFAQHSSAEHTTGSWYNDISSPHGQPGTSTTPHNLGHEGKVLPPEFGGFTGLHVTVPGIVNVHCSLFVDVTVDHNTAPVHELHCGP
jgi:hypothetical protein